MLIREIMTKNVVTIDSNQTILEAYKKYRDFKVGCLIVTDKDQCVGIVTERDLIERSIHRDLETTMIKEIMTSDVKTIHPFDNLEKALEIIKKYKIKKLPVVSDNMVEGIITITDITYARPELTERFMESWVKPRWED